MNSLDCNEMKHGFNLDCNAHTRLKLDSRLFCLSPRKLGSQVQFCVCANALNALLLCFGSETPCPKGSLPTAPPPIPSQAENNDPQVSPSHSEILLNENSNLREAWMPPPTPAFLACASFRTPDWPKGQGGWE